MSIERARQVFETMTDEQAANFAELGAMIAFGVKVSQVIPVSELYEDFGRHGVPVADFSTALSVLIAMEWIAEDGMVLTWTKD